jgi:hypothetical protein
VISSPLKILFLIFSAVKIIPDLRLFVVRVKLYILFLAAGSYFFS